MPKPRIVVRPLRTITEFQQCERIQETVWGRAGVSGELMLVTAKNGGLVIGAFCGAHLAGFIYAFLARRHGQLIHWSHLMAVEPAFRDRRLGFRMKLEHRRRALAQGIRCVAWTYDPLQSRNASLNIHRLGAEVREYLPDCYGSFQSKIECGLPSDRFVAEWRIASAHVQHRLEAGRPATLRVNLPQVNSVHSDERGFVTNRRLRLSLSEPRLLVEIPRDPDGMRTLDLDLARRWRLDMRRVFQHYFGKDYRVSDFFSPADTGARRAFYVLARSHH
jgi:predicted GNAT superfamily acetyltransferase